MTINLKGDVSNKAIVEIYYEDKMNRDFIKQKEFYLNKGDVNISSSADWYQNKAKIKYIPQEGTTGHLKMKVEFVALTSK